MLWTLVCSSVIGDVVPRRPRGNVSNCQAVAFLFPCVSLRSNTTWRWRMSLIKIFGPVIDIYCGLNQITIEFHLAHEFFDPWAPFFSELRTPPLPAPPRPWQTVFSSSLSVLKRHWWFWTCTRRTSPFCTRGGQRAVNNAQRRFNLNRAEKAKIRFACVLHINDGQLIFPMMHCRRCAWVLWRGIRKWLWA